MLRNQTQCAAMLVRSLPTKSRKSVSHNIFATHADLVYDIIDTDYQRHMAVTHYHVFMTLKHVFLTYKTRNLVETAVRMFFSYSRMSRACDASSLWFHFNGGFTVY